MKAFLLGLLFCSAAFATTLIKADLAFLTKNSDAVVVGTVGSVQSRMSGDGKRIITDSEIAVSQTLKGTVPATVVVMQPGGEVGDVGQYVSGVARFATGEEVIVFLEKRGDRFFVTGLAQGKYRVEHAADGKRYAVPAKELDAEVVDPLTHQPVAPSTTPVLFETFVQQIVAAVGQSTAPAKTAPKGLESRP